MIFEREATALGFGPKSNILAVPDSNFVKAKKRREETIPLQRLKPGEGRFCPLLAFLFVSELLLLFFSDTLLGIQKIQMELFNLSVA